MFLLFFETVLKFHEQRTNVEGLRLFRLSFLSEKGKSV